MSKLIKTGLRVQSSVTSPPYWNLRNYSVPGQLGQEKTPDEYVDNLVEVFSLVKELLHDDGTLWLNLGDSYASTQKNRTVEQALARSTLNGSPSPILKQRSKIIDGLKTKDLVGIPWRVAFALQSDGWYLRSDIIWSKPNPMPESVKDRPTRSHEYIFLLSKSSKYYYDAEAIREPGKNPEDDVRRLFQQKQSNKSSPTDKQNGLRTKNNKQRGHSRRHTGFSDRWDQMSKEEQSSYGRNKRDVWLVPTQPYHGAHFATFPSKLIEPCILAGTRKSDIVFDPFLGSGTVGEVAQKLGRQWIGCELNEQYKPLQEERTSQIGMEL